MAAAKKESGLEKARPTEQKQTLAVLFTDMVGSSRLYHERGDQEARRLVRLHFELMEKPRLDCGGRLIKTIGDSILATFPRAKNALECAMRMQQAFRQYNADEPPADQMHIRIGVHYGEVFVEDNDVHGDVVNIAARIEEGSAGDEIYTSRACWQAARSLDTEIEALGPRSFKGILTEIELVRVLWDPEQIKQVRKQDLQQTILPDLARAIARGRCVLILGGQKIKTSREELLSKHLAALLDLDDRKRPLPQVASLFEEEFGRDELAQCAEAFLRQAQTAPPDMLPALTALPIDVILTTLRDHRLEQALAAAGRTPRKHIGFLDAELNQASEEEVSLVKMFGDLDQKESLVLTEEGIAECLGQLKLAPPELQAALSTGHLFFLGFRPSDPFFKRLYRALQAFSPSDHLRATGVYAKITPGVRRQFADHGLQLCEVQETSFCAQLQTLVQECEQEIEQSDSETGQLVQSDDGRHWKRPYKFLAYFEEADADIFFGRAEETRKLYSLVVSHHLVLLHAPSGTGKTSLLNAGVIPRLQKEGYAVIARRALKDPEQEIRTGVIELLAATDKKHPGAQVLSLDLPRLLQTASRALSQPLVIVLDQFEEFFIRFSKKVRMSFIDELAQVLADPSRDVRFLLSMRHDFLSHLAEFKKKIPDIFHQELRITNLSAEGMVEAVEAPAALAGLSYEDGLVARILTDLGTVGSEPPQLQIVCDRLYDALGEQDLVFTHKHYQGLGEAKGILGGYLEQFIQSCQPAQKTIIQKTLKALVTSLGTKTVLSVDLLARETGQAERAVREALEQLLDARLCRKLTADEGEAYELSHEFLIAEIGKWIDEKDRALKQARELLRQELQNFEKFGLLMTPARIDIIEKHKVELRLGEQEKALLRKSRHQKRKRRSLMAFAIFLFAILILFGSQSVYRQIKLGLCQGAQRKLAGIWDPTIKKKVKSAFLATGLNYAPDTYQKVTEHLDSYMHNWLAMHNEACAATSIHGEQTEQILQLRMTCLQRKLNQVSSLTHLFANSSDTQTVEKATEAVRKLGSLSLCANVEALSLTYPLPDDPATQEAIEQLQKQAAKAEALSYMGRFSESETIAQKVHAKAVELAYMPFIAQTLYLKGSLLDQSGKYVKAESIYRKTLLAAAKVRNTLLIAETWTDIIKILTELGKYAEANTLNQAAEVAVEEVANNARIRSKYYSSQAYLFLKRAKYKQAQEYYKLALAMAQKTGDVHNLQSYAAYMGLGTVTLYFGNLEDAHRYYQDSLSLLERLLGPAHPRVVRPLTNLGLVFKKQKKFTLAKDYFQRALTITQDALGPDHPDIGYALMNLGNLAGAEGNLTEAKDLYERALNTWQKSLGLEHPNIGDILNNLGTLLLGNGDFRQAMNNFERAAEVWKKALGPEHPKVAIAIGNLGRIFCEEKKYAKALRLQRNALSILKKTFGENHERVASAKSALASTLQKDNQLVEARQLLGQLILFYKNQPSDQEELADVQFKLAVVLWINKDWRKKARTLAETAHKYYISANNSEKARSIETKKWLENHRLNE